MDDNAVRAELERIDPTCSAWWELLQEFNDVESREGKMLRCLAESQQALREIREIIEAVDYRCMAVDGPVTPTLQEMTPKEIKRIYKLAKKHCKEE